MRKLRTIKNDLSVKQIKKNDLKKLKGGTNLAIGNPDILDV